MPPWRLSLHGDADTLVQVWTSQWAGAIARTPEAARQLRALDGWSPEWEEDGIGPGWDRWLEPPVTSAPGRS